MTVSSGAALRLVELLNFDEIGVFVLCDDHLGYALAIVHHELRIRKFTSSTFTSPL